MRVKETSNKHWVSTKDTVFLGLFEGETKLALQGLPDEDREFLHDSMRSLSFTGKADQVLSLRLPTKINAIAVGLGPQEGFSLAQLRNAIASAIKAANKAGVKEIAFSLAISELFNKSDAAKSIAEAAIMSGYKFENFKAEKSQQTVENIVLSDANDEEKKAIEAAADAGQLFGELNIKARDLVNTPPSIATPIYMADQAKAIAKDCGLALKAYGLKEIQGMGMNGILAVNSGAHAEPRLVVMEYKANSDRTIALVGKGVCFDSGGLDIKPASAMDTMKMDKAGAIAVMVAMEAVAKLKPSINVVGIMPFVQNLVSDSSYKPGDIIRTMSGKTIEVLNTDAEGRVILSDALHFAVEKYSPEAVIDLATLTGAVIIALGNNVAALIGNDRGLVSKLIVAGSKTCERLWELPMFEDYAELMKSDHADVKNVISNTPGNPAGTITGAVFLSHFVGEAKWAHLDVAGTAWANEEKGYNSKGATGFGVRLLAQFLMDYE